MKKLRGLYQEALNEDDNYDLIPLFHELKDTHEPYLEADLIGEGALKQVLKTYDTRAARYIALAKPRTGLDIKFYDIFIHEARITSALQHPNIIKVHDVGITEDNLPYFTMDLKANKTLESLSSHSIHINERLNALLKVCDALSHAHSRHIIHLDLKPENIQCDRFGEVLVCDWGLAKYIDDPKRNLPEGLNDDVQGHKTLIGDIKGSLGYMSPEHVDNTHPKDERSDIYSLGCLLYYLLTDQAPYQGSKSEVLEQTLASSTPQLAKKLAEAKAPKSLSLIVQKAMQKEPSNRYQSVVDFRADLQSFLSFIPTSLERSNSLNQLFLFIKRNQKSTTLSILALTTITFLSVLGRSLIKEQEEQVTLQADQIESLNTSIDTITLQKGSLQHFINTIGIKDQFLRKVTDKSIYNLDETHSHKDAVRLTKALLDGRGFNESDNLVYCRDLVHLVTLNLKALSYRPQFLNTGAYRLFREKQPWFDQYDFTEDHRPSVEELTYFIQECQKSELINFRCMEAIIRYDMDTREDFSNYNQVIIALIKYMNQKHELQLTENSAENSITLSAPSQLHLTSTLGKRSVVTYLNVDNLILEQPVFDIARLDHFSATKIDLSNCEKIMCSSDVVLPHLEVVSLPQELPYKQFIEKKITGSKDSPLTFLYR